MSDRAWKRTERRIARALGGQRVPVSGRGDGPDVAHPWLSVEVKHRASLPVWLIRALGQAVHAATSEQLPLLVLHEAGRHDSMVVMRLSDFVEWFGGGILSELSEE